MKQTVGFQFFKLFVVSLVLLGAGGGYFYSQLQVLDQSSRKSQGVAQLGTDIEHTYRGLEELMLTRGADQAIAPVKESLRAVQVGLVKLGIDYGRNDHHRLFTNRWKEILTSLAPLLIPNNPDLQDRSLVESRRRGLRTQMLGLKNDLRAFQQSEMALVDEANRSIRRVLYAGLAMTVAWLGFVFWRLNISISRPLRLMTASIREVTEEQQDPELLKKRAEEVAADLIQQKRVGLREIQAMEEAFVSLLRGQRRAVKLSRDYATRLKEKAQNLSHRVQHDELTQLGNRRRFNDELNRLLALSRDQGGSVALMALDLDHFKEVNDTFGHEAGDCLLVEVAHRLRASLKKRDLACRLGGDEFAVLLVDIDDLDKIAEVARRVVDLISQPYAIGDKLITIGCSLGVAICPRDGDETADLMRAADKAMYKAKRQGKGCFRFCSGGERYVDHEPAKLDDSIVATQLRVPLPVTRSQCRLGLNACPLDAPFGACGDCKMSHAIQCRRDLSPAGLRRRDVFGKLHGVLQEEGLENGRARQAILNAMNGLAAQQDEDIGGEEVLWELLESKKAKG